MGRAKSIQMDYSEIHINTIILRIIEFVVLGGSFYLACFLLSIQVESNIIIQTLIYSSTAFLSVTLGKWLLSSTFTSAGVVIKLMIINAVGLFIGAIIMLIYVGIFPELGEFGVAIVLASVMAFFVFGTLSPLLKSNTHSLL